MGARLVHVLPLVLLLAARAAAGRDLLYSSFADDPGRYLDAVRGGPPPAARAPAGRVAGGIVTHHFLAAPLMVEFFDASACTARPRLVILIGPDHERLGPRGISLSALDWRTPFGVLACDREAVGGLRQALRLPPGDDAAVFFREHSTGLLVPFIRLYFPDARVLPILLSDRAGPRRIAALAGALAPLLGDDALVILSMDFSHGKAPAEAAALDRDAMAAIVGCDLARVRDLDVDCHAGLELMLRLFRGRPVAFGTRTDSAAIAGRPLADCTSYVTTYFLR
ncbi:MAG: AmmeMemoRadiSam system protein B [Candidatus Coatesbacteria bacterium]